MCDIIKTAQALLTQLRQSQKERKKKRQENIQKIMAENGPYLMKSNLHIQKKQLALRWTNAKRSTIRYIIVKMLKVKSKEKMLKAAREKQLVMYQGTVKDQQVMVNLEQWSLKDGNMTYSKYRKKKKKEKPVNQEFNIQ